MHCSCFVPFTKPEALLHSKIQIIYFFKKLVGKKEKKLQIKAANYFFKGCLVSFYYMWEVRRCNLPTTLQRYSFLLMCNRGQLSNSYLQLLRIIVAKYPLDLDFVITLFILLRQLRRHVKSIACFNGAENKEIIQKHGGPL